MLLVERGGLSCGDASPVAKRGPTTTMVDDAVTPINAIAYSKLARGNKGMLGCKAARCYIRPCEVVRRTWHSQYTMAVEWGNSARCHSIFEFGPPPNSRRLGGPVVDGGWSPFLFERFIDFSLYF